MVDPGNRERGLKAAINNPRVSEQAKQRDREILENEYGEGADPEYIPTTEPYEDMSSSKMSKSKSTGSAPSSSSHTTSSSSAPKSASSSSEYSTTSSFSAGQGMRTKAPPSSSGIMLPEEESEMSTTGSSGMTGGKDTGNVIRGLKAAISNPNVSDKAKERDHQKLRELGGE